MSRLSSSSPRTSETRVPTEFRRETKGSSIDEGADGSVERRSSQADMPAVPATPSKASIAIQQKSAVLLRQAAEDVIDSVTRPVKGEADEAARDRTTKDKMAKAESAYRALRAQGMPHETAFALFTTASAAQLKLKTATEVKNASERGGFDPVVEWAAAGNTNIVQRELAAHLKSQDMYAQRRTPREAEHAKEKPGPMHAIKSAWRATKDTKRGATAEIGERAALTAWSSQRQAVLPKAIGFAAAACNGVARAEPDARPQAAEKALQGLLKLQAECASDDEFAAYLEAGFLHMDLPTLFAFAAALADGAMKASLTDGSRSVFQLVRASVDRVCDLFPSAAGQAAAAPRRSSLPANPEAAGESKFASELISPPQSRLLAIADIRSATSKLMRALSEDNAENARIDEALDQLCQAMLQLPTAEAMEILRNGALLQTTGPRTEGAHAIKNASTMLQDWLTSRKPATPTGTSQDVVHRIVERNVIRTLKELDLAARHREQRDGEHAQEVASAKGVELLAMPVKQGFRGIKDFLRARDKTHGKGKEALEQRARDAQLKAQTAAKAERAAATPEASEDDLEYALMNTFGELIESVLPETANVFDQKLILEALEDALVVRSPQQIAEMRTAFTPELKGNLEDAYRDIDPSMIPRIDLLSAALANVQRVHAAVHNPHAPQVVPEPSGLG